MVGINGPWIVVSKGNMSLSPDIFLKSPLLDRGLLCYNKNRQNAAGFFAKLFLRRYISQQQLLSTHIPIPVSSIYNIYIYHIFSGLESPRFYKRFSFHESSVFPFFTISSFIIYTTSYDRSHEYSLRSSFSSGCPGINGYCGRLAAKNKL